MAEKERILVVDDEPSIRKYLQTLLEVDGYEVTPVSGRERWSGSRGPAADFVILDVLMPEMNGLETLRQHDAGGPHAQRDHAFLLERSDHGGGSDSPGSAGLPDQAVRKGRAGRGASEVPAEDGAAQGESGAARILRSSDRGLSFLAASPQMVRIRQQILQIAPVDVPVFISGESGVGKEVVARMIHMRSTRRSQPFVKVNCAALPGELLESELFGYEQGAFTGAVRSKPGKFELANKGTIFLDEIAEMSPHLQAKLLHVLQDHQYSRLGGATVVDVDVRVLAATNVEVQEAMKSGRLREDLYYRLNVLSINVPPLRERTTEIPLLFRHFLVKIQRKISEERPRPPST
jgi:two-component system response regulator AtoC